MDPSRRKNERYNLWVQVGSVVVSLLVAGVVFYNSVTVQLAVIDVRQTKIVEVMGEIKTALRQADLGRMGERQNSIEKRMVVVEHKLFKL